MEKIFRIFDFNICNDNKTNIESSDSEEEVNRYTDSTSFIIQMFGVNETGETCSVLVEDFKPFFYVMVNDNWNIQTKDMFLINIKTKMGKFYKDSISECIIIKRKKLYGFDGGKEHKFIKFEFTSMNAFNKAKNIWYTEYGQDGRHLLPKGYIFNNTETKLYEANIPPLLRFFHIRDISPSGWIALPNKKCVQIENRSKRTTCNFECIINYKNIIPLNNMEVRVPYKICSFDIEASSSHGDFPIPIKSYKKLATNIIEYFENLKMDLTQELCKNILRRIISAAFGYEKMDEIDLVYPKEKPKTKQEVDKMCEKWLEMPVRNFTKSQDFTNATTIESYYEKISHGEEEEEENHFKGYVKSYNDKKATIIDIIRDKKFERDGKLNELNISLNTSFPKLEGDKVTFIGSTFMNYGEEEPNMNHCIVLNTCSKMPIENSILESYNTEKEVLLAWQQLIQRENPDIIIGYNIFGFDYEFMFRRAEENDCVEEFLKLSRNKNEICAIKDRETGRYKIEESTLQIASGQHDLRFIKINGRLQVDLYNFFRREENLSSYKLDYVAGHFIGDYIKNLEYNTNNTETEIKTMNMTGLLEGSFIHFEEIGHSVDYYDNGAKFKVIYVNKKEGKFKIEGKVNPDLTKKVRWCLAKDDVTPKDIFRMTNGSADDRSVIAKYCIQDCNLVHYLFNKADILTGFIEMAKICSVPINFLVMRGQGIKLTSYIAKKCREKRTLMPVIEKGGLDDGYEGAIVLDPKCDLYLDNPVACVDYASLYPSCMISENLSHDSKVWTREYDLAGNLFEETGEKDKDGNFIYDNLPDYEYVDINYDTYKYIRKTPASAAEKVRSGFKMCRFAQFPDGKKAIMPSILEELLGARKATRKLIPQQKDDFIKNVLDKRQLGYKVTANSLYGQCGAKTSTFYEMDIAAATTATGRLLLVYAKKVIEECYGNNICNTKHYGNVKTQASCVYGDTDSVFFTFNLQTPEGKPIRGKEALEITIELAQEAGHLASGFLKCPHDLEYEKTFMPFCLLSKKRYVGMLYETDPNKCKRKEMGIVLKRRDNAPIVKDIYGGIIDILMKEQNIQKAIEFLKQSLQNLVDEKVSMDKLIITKSLRSGYKNPKSIAHKVLSDRMTARDAGNKPSSGDRIPFVYINNTNKKALQGEKIETPTYILENNLKIDYSFYISNQIMKPVQQVFALVLEKIWEQQKKTGKIKNFKKDVETLRKTIDPEKFEDKLEQLKNKEVKALLFDDYLRVTTNEKEGNQSLTKFFGKK
jgi:DNA polymerase elongation subunit (family B)